MLRRAGLTALLVALGVAAPAHATTYGAGDTGVVNVSRSPGASEGEEPLSVNPVNPAEMTAVANVFEPNLPPPFDKIFGRTEGAPREMAETARSRKPGRWLQRWGMIQSSLENFIGSGGISEEDLPRVSPISDASAGAR